MIHSNLHVLIIIVFLFVHSPFSRIASHRRLMQWWSQSYRLVCPLLLGLFQSAFLHLLEQLVLQGEQFPRPLIDGILLPHARVPPAVQSLPEANVSHADDRLQHRLDGHIAPTVQRITILFVGWIYKRPQRDGAIFQICGEGVDDK